jgi:RNA polymerase sigma-70 factor (ECF subfamily)
MTVEPGAAKADAQPTTYSFEDWYRAEHPKLLGALTLVCGNRDSAQDVASEAFARALARWSRVAEMESPTGWTFRVAVNVLRRRERRRATEARLLRRATPETAVPFDGSIEIWDAVHALPRRERLAIALRYAAGLSEPDVAAAMDIKVGTASATLASARRKLAVALAEPPVRVMEEA